MINGNYAYLLETIRRYVVIIWPGIIKNKLTEGVCGYIIKNTNIRSIMICEKLFPWINASPVRINNYVGTIDLI
jgi:hypothetical protein